MYDTYESISNPHTTETFSTSYVTLTTFISQVKVIAQISQVKAIATLAALYVLIHPAPLLRETPSTCKHAGTTPFAHAVRCTSTLKVVGPVRKTCTTRKQSDSDSMGAGPPQLELGKITGRSDAAFQRAPHCERLPA